MTTCRKRPPRLDILGGCLREVQLYYHRHFTFDILQKVDCRLIFVNSNIQANLSIIILCLNEVCHLQLSDSGIHENRRKDQIFPRVKLNHDTYLNNHNFFTNFPDVEVINRLQYWTYVTAIFPDRVSTYRVATVRENQILLMLREKSGSFIIKLLQIILLDVSYSRDKAISFYISYLSHPHFCLFMTRIIVLYGQ